MRSIQPLATKVAATEGLKGADGRKEARSEARGDAWNACFSFLGLPVGFITS